MVYHKKSRKRHSKFKKTMPAPMYYLVRVMICLRKNYREKKEKTGGGNVD